MFVSGIRGNEENGFSQLFDFDFDLAPTLTAAFDTCRRGTQVRPARAACLKESVGSVLTNKRQSQIGHSDILRPIPTHDLLVLGAPPGGMHVLLTAGREKAMPVPQHSLAVDI